ncbi:MAG TPA: SCO family protein [Pirellulales bacterium]|nr:SCO family protein [Pirellulales bacterium]
MTSPAAKAWISFLLVAIGLYGSYTIWKVYKANAIAATVHREPSTQNSRSISKAFPPIPLDEFTFTDSEGQPFSLQNLSGKVWVASFFFATCPGFCLQMNQEIAKIARDLSDQDVTFVSFTVDPENDTPDVLKEYATRMQADPRRWVFLTGKQADIQELGQQYFKVPATKDHLDKLLLVGRDGREHNFFASRDPQDVKRLKEAIAECLAAKAPPTSGPPPNPAPEPSAEQPDSDAKVPE